MQISCPCQPCLKSAVTKHTVPGILQRPLQCPYDSTGNFKKWCTIQGLSIIVFLHMVYFVLIFLTVIHVHIFVYYPLAYIFRGP